MAFDFTAAMRRLCEDICRRTEPLGHVDMSRVAVGFAQTRRATSHGTFASLTPMRFAGGGLVQSRRGRQYTVQRLFDRSGREMLYILTFYLPRFLDMAFDEKLVTVFHELWHMSPEFDGDIRRFQGRCFVHSKSQQDYDQQMGELSRDWLAQQPPIELYEFLRLDFKALNAAHGPVFGSKFTRPKLIPAVPQ